MGTEEDARGLFQCRPRLLAVCEYGDGDRESRWVVGCARIVEGLRYAWRLNLWNRWRLVHMHACNAGDSMRWLVVDEVFALECIQMSNLTSLALESDDVRASVSSREQRTVERIGGI